MTDTLSLVIAVAVGVGLITFELGFLLGRQFPLRAARFCWCKWKHGDNENCPFHGIEARKRLREEPTNGK